jgi:hypothetical protein
MIRGKGVDVESERADAEIKGEDAEERLRGDAEIKGEDAEER